MDFSFVLRPRLAPGLALLVLVSAPLQAAPQLDKPISPARADSAAVVPGAAPEATDAARPGPLPKARALVAALNPEAVRLAVDDLIATHGARYPRGVEYRARLLALEGAVAAAKAACVAADDAALLALLGPVSRYQEIRDEALLANPLLDAGQLMLVRRSSGKLGLPANWQGNSSISATGYDNAIVVLSPVRPTGTLTTLYKPENGRFVGDLNLHFDGRKVLFSMPGGANERWNLWEIGCDGTQLKQLTQLNDKDVDAYDGAYLPDGGVVFMCSATYQGVPCVGGSDYVANLYRMDGNGGNMRRLTFDQEMNWSPMVMNDGRVLFTRWEYTDNAHYFTRLLFTMNPDGTGQQSIYGSNSYWPNSMFYARQVPGSPSKLITIVSGHHGVKRAGELILLDLAKGRQEADGVVQRIPGRGQRVVPVMADRLVDKSWPRFLHPQPLSDKYFIVSGQLDAKADWGIYLVDVFDNIVPIYSIPGQALLEPTPLKATVRPPVIPDRVRPDEKTATVLLTDVYSGPGLAGIPRGAVKRLRLYSYNFNQRNEGSHDKVGIHSGWEVKRILGTVPVEADGSASFSIPANTPIAVQPLDEQGRTLQAMRSWFTGQPGEVVSCVGCHDQQNSAPPASGTIASRRAPSPVQSWYGPARPFAFTNEVQPVLDRSCVACHDGGPGKPAPTLANPTVPASFKQDVAYLALHPYVRRPGPESDCHLMRPMEYHTSTSELMQMLAQGHHGVTLDSEALDRLNTWIDLNAPWRGSWAADGKPAAGSNRQRRLELDERYAGSPVDSEGEFAAATAARLARGKITPVTPIAETHVPPLSVGPVVPGWPFDAAKAAQLQQGGGAPATRTLDLGEGVTLELTRIPGGRFLMGDAAGNANERPATPVEIGSAFWMGRFEITNRQYRRFDATHDSRYIDQQWKDHTTPGYPANQPEQPVIRVTWKQAQAFCAWLSKRTGETVALPTEAQWEWACRAGSATPNWFGGADADFSPFANLADHSLTRFAVRGVNPQPMKNPGPDDAFIPRRDDRNDGQMISGPVGRYKPNPWGLYDMQGNVAEWTRTTYHPYPYSGDGREQSAGRLQRLVRHVWSTPYVDGAAGDATVTGPKVVRGGSWRDRPQRATSAFRLAYEPYQPVYNVGFRVIIESK
jgi:formylglycine-generating enzyme required for sulfatase activity